MANGRLIPRQAGGPAELPMRRSGWRCNRPDARAGCRARCKKSTYSRRRATVSTVKKSTASMLCACVRRNSRQESPTRSPAGPDQTREAVCAQSWPRPRSQVREARQRSADNPTEGSRDRGVAPAPGSRRRSAAGPPVADTSSAWRQPTVPAKQRRWSDDKRAPTRSRQQLARGGKEYSIGRPQLGPTGLTP